MPLIQSLVCERAFLISFGLLYVCMHGTYSTVAVCLYVLNVYIYTILYVRYLSTVLVWASLSFPRPLSCTVHVVHQGMRLFGKCSMGKTKTHTGKFTKNRTRQFPTKLGGSLWCRLILTCDEHGVQSWQNDLEAQTITCVNIQFRMWLVISMSCRVLIFVISILSVARDASEDDIRKHYRKLAVLIHPDKVSEKVVSFNVIYVLPYLYCVHHDGPWTVTRLTLLTFLFDC